MAQDGPEGDMSSLNISSTATGHEDFIECNETRSQASDMQQRAKLLLDELTQFQQYLKNRKRDDVVYLGAFKSDVQQELKLLEKVDWLSSDVFQI